ncbi:Hypothetical protein R9X50_00400400 [Acrodontium crateriforme]|uniref:Uncharacterized protein n=1 Tax=Acrodontium crateriforme TaxID=150365 RepID=A0AAQ3RCC5_9PEZI|nr:Hypothetical protein R9X50_00400400 [Acrodontium crateriforme]
MNEAPKDHDFDQRHDGPFPVGESIHLDTCHPPDETNPTSPVSLADVTSSKTPGLIAIPSKADAPRKSVTIEAARDEAISPTGRKSTQMSRSRRDSRDFDVRRDGPYGRPSLTMSRRKSSGLDQTNTNESNTSDIPPVPAPGPVHRVESAGNEQAPGPETLEAALSSVETGFEPEPPRLNYTLWTRKWSIAFFWSLILLDCIAMPIGLYFGLWYGTNLSPNVVFSIVTAALGGISIFEYFLRFWRLWKKGSTCRVIGARRMYLDFFHWNFSLGWTIIMIELIVGTVPQFPPIRLLAMPVTSMMYAFGTELLIVDILRYFKIPAPFRVSSIPKGSQLRPGIYSVIEDVCAVDGSGGTEFREALNRRYEASHVFRAMLRRLGMFWAIGSELMAVVLTILIFTIQKEAAYVVGWAVPFIWAGIWTAITFWYVNRKLKEETITWAEELAQKNAS